MLKTVLATAFGVVAFQSATKAIGHPSERLLAVVLVLVVVWMLSELIRMVWRGGAFWLGIPKCITLSLAEEKKASAVIPLSGRGLPLHVWAIVDEPPGVRQPLVLAMRDPTLPEGIEESAWDREAVIAVPRWYLRARRSGNPGCMLVPRAVRRAALDVLMESGTSPNASIRLFFSETFALRALFRDCRPG